MTTKQMLLSALILGATTNGVWAMETAEQDRVLNNGWHNQINNASLNLCLLSQRHTGLDNILILKKYRNGDLAKVGTIGQIKNSDHPIMLSQILQTTTSDNAVLCNNQMIIIDTEDVKDCQRLRDAYSLFAALNK